MPTELIAAFRATLEEVAEADVILHVRDVAHPDSAPQRADVIAVLDGMARDDTLDADWRDRTIEVLNKADLLGGIDKVPIRPGLVAVSAITGEGLRSLLTAIDARIAAGMELADYDLLPEDGARLAWLSQAWRGARAPRCGCRDPCHGPVAARGQGQISSSTNELFGR